MPPEIHPSSVPLTRDSRKPVWVVAMFVGMGIFIAQGIALWAVVVAKHRVRIYLPVFIAFIIGAVLLGIGTFRLLKTARWLRPGTTEDNNQR